MNNPEVIPINFPHYSEWGKIIKLSSLEFNFNEEFHYIHVASAHKIMQIYVRFRTEIIGEVIFCMSNNIEKYRNGFQINN